MKKVFINGEAGTTGLKIHARLAGRSDIKLISLPPELRKDPAAIGEIINEADIAFLCLPDSAAQEVVGMVSNPDTVIIDTSTAHRTAAGWTYGFPELSAEHAEKIASSKRISVPGCHASGFIALVFPLIEAGVLSRDASLCCTSLTGYSGGGKSMIAEYESSNRPDALDSPRVYAITQQHKHLREMKVVTGLERFPHFTPIVADYLSGMLVTVPLFSDMLSCTAAELREIYRKKYSDGLVRYCESIDNAGFIASNELSGFDGMKIAVAGGDERITLYAQFDNLGKGASGAAVECMNLALGIDKETGLAL